MTNEMQKIPEGWSVKKLGDLTTQGIFNGIFNDPQKVGKGTPLINVVDLYEEKINYSNLSLLEVSENELQKYEAQEGDLLFTRSSLKLEGIAHCNLVKKYPKRVVFDCHLMRVRTNKILANSYYLYSCCNMSNVKKEFMKHAKTTTMTTIDQNGLGNVKLLLPPLAEQEKIAEILSCWDEGIEKLSALIDRKKALKKGLMQKLLTGSFRLKGFATPWHEVQLGDICNITGGTSKAQYIEDNGEYLIVDMGAVSNEANLIAKKRTKFNKDFLDINDLIMPKDDIGGGNIIGKSVIIKEKDKYILGDHVFKIVVKKDDPSFVCMKINSFNVNKYMRRCATGSAQLGLSKKDVSNCLLNIPSDISEQKAIANILETQDKEIELLEQKLENLKQEKKALMQQLLTGKTRVKVN